MTYTKYTERKVKSKVHLQPKSPLADTLDPNIRKHIENIYEIDYLRFFEN
jgi:hypothetical protein